MHAFQEISPTFLFASLQLLRLTEENQIGTMTWIKIAEALRLECGCDPEVVDEYIEFRFDHTTLIMRIPGDLSPVSAPIPPRTNPPKHGKPQHVLDIVH